MRFLLAGRPSVRNGRFDAARRKEQPFEIGTALRVADGNIEFGVWKFIGEISADGGRLGDDHVSIALARLG